MDIKNILKEEIFKEENGEYLIDLYLDGKKQKSEFSSETIKFLESKKDDLLKEHTKEYAFEKKFFKKYGYENIIENYSYDLNKIIKNKKELDINSKSKQNKNTDETGSFKIFKKNINNNKKKSAQKSNKKQKRSKTIAINDNINKTNNLTQNNDLTHIANRINQLNWNKTIINQHLIYYSSFDYINYLPIEVILSNNKKYSNKFLYNNKLHGNLNYRVVRYLFKEIERTNPKNELIDVAVTYDIKPENIHFILDKVQNNCKYKSEEKCLYKGACYFVCSALHRDCIYYNNFFSEVSKEKQREENINNDLKLKSIKNTKPDKKDKENKKENKKTEVQKLPNKKINIKDFVVRMNIFKCIHKEHKIIDIVAEVNVINTENKIQSIKISAGYCQQCETYFIMESIYKHLKNNGIILCRISDEKSYIRSISGNGMDLAKESILMQYGYNVSATEGLSAKRRQRILSVIIDNKIMSKNEIINYIDFFIRQRNNRSNMELAISKWEADREFVENYRIGEFTKFEVNSIYRK